MTTHLYTVVRIEINSKVHGWMRWGRYELLNHDDLQQNDGEMKSMVNNRESRPKEAHVSKIEGDKKSDEV